MNALKTFFAKMWRLHDKIENNVQVLSPLESYQDADTMAIWLGGPLATSKPVQFLKCVSGPATVAGVDNVYTMQPVEFDSANKVYINAGAEIYMEG